MPFVLWAYLTTKSCPIFWKWTTVVFLFYFILFFLFFVYFLLFNALGIVFGVDVNYRNVNV